jgi:2-polyprenyl-3-methyl-5-hydroxy-6-metoxy-1,4-benzoquinol methylase
MPRDLQAYERAYLDQPFERFQVECRREVVLEMLTQRAPKSILEVGCGVRPLFDSFPDFERFAVVEPAEAFHAIAAERASGHPRGAQIQVVRAMIEDAQTELGARTFDAIVVSSLLHEVPQPTELLRQLRRYAHSGTRLHVNVPNAWSFHRRLAVEAGLMPSVFEASESNRQFQQNSVFDLESLARLAGDAGYEVESSGSYSFKPFTHRQMQSVLDHGIVDENIVTALNRMAHLVPDFAAEIFVNLRPVTEEK